MENYSILTITVYDVDTSYDKVNDLLHQYAGVISLRVGYPIPEKSVAVIFLIVKTNGDTLGAFSGKLGQISGIKVKSSTLKISN